MSVDFLMKVNRTGAEYQQDFSQLRPLGYRPISLCIYNGGDPRYAAVWVRRGGADWSGVHGLTAAQYQAAFDSSVAAGYQPHLISATGVGAGVRIAGTFEQGVGTPLTRYGLISGSVDDPNAIEHWNREAQRNGWVMTCGSVYGDDASRRFAGIWRGNAEQVAWNADGIHETSSQYQARYSAQASGFARPAFVTRSDSGAILSIFRDDVIGPVVARHDLSLTDLNGELSRLQSLGYFPICLQASGGIDPRFAALFAMRDEPLPREWRVTGSPVVTAVDEAVRTGLQASMIRGASIAVVRGTRLVAARGYTWAEPGYPTVLPHTVFRIASVSKTVTAIAVQQLIEQNRLALSDTLGTLLPIPGPRGPMNPDFAAITVQELLEHRSGVMGGIDESAVRTAFGGVTRPVVTIQAACYVAGQPLADPAKPVAYNNVGYWLLGLVVRFRSPAPTFYDAIRTRLLEPLGITRLRLSVPQVWAADQDEARYDRLGQTLDASGSSRAGLIIGSSVMQDDQPLVPWLYGDRNLLNEDASGGLSAAAPDLARLVAALNVATGSAILQRTSVTAMLQNAASFFASQPLGTDRRAGYGFDDMTAVGAGFNGSKGGYLFTSQNMLWFQLDDTSLVINLNGTSMVNVMGPVWDVVRTASWDAMPDLFPDFGMPSF